MSSASQWWYQYLFACLRLIFLHEQSSFGSFFLGKVLSTVLWLIASFSLFTQESVNELPNSKLLRSVVPLFSPFSFKELLPSATQLYAFDILVNFLSKVVFWNVQLPILSLFYSFQTSFFAALNSLAVFSLSVHSSRKQSLWGCACLSMCGSLNSCYVIALGLAVVQSDQLTQPTQWPEGVFKIRPPESLNNKLRADLHLNRQK